MNTEKKPVRSRTSEMTIENTIFIVTTTFNENARETAEDKFVRYVADRISADMKDADMGLIAEKTSTCYVGDSMA